MQVLLLNIVEVVQGQLWCIKVRNYSGKCECVVWDVVIGESSLVLGKGGNSGGFIIQCFGIGKGIVFCVGNIYNLN